jgi:hypothetical protein
MPDSTTPPKRSRKSKAETVLILRTCAADLRSYNDFQWPESGPVEVPDWDSAPHCGNGLHGYLWGEGDAGLANWSSDAKWLVVEVEKSTIVDLGGKVKFPRGKVVCCGTRLEATTYLHENGGRGYRIIGGTATAGDRGTATAGDRGTATAGDGGTATAGYAGTIIIKRWNGMRYKFAVGYIGEDGLLPNVAYKLDSDGNFVEAPRSAP